MKMVKIENFSNRGRVLPEQGSWHLERKKQILEKHPEVRQLIGTNPWTAVVFLIPFTLQMLLCCYVESAPFWQLVVLSYTVGSFLSSGMGVLGHEGAHGLVFANPRWLNKLFACIAFTPVFIGPFGNYWAVEHMYHHQVVVDKMNRYGPQQSGLFFKLIVTLLFIHLLSLVFFITSSTLMAVCVVTITMKLLGLRKKFFVEKFALPPYKNFPQIIGKWFVVNQIITNGFFFSVYYFIGPWAVLYLYLSISWANSLHPLGMRQVQEHYLRKKDQPTNSVYGLTQPLVFNVGYHNEHHDFPNIPWNRLPKLHRLAPEFYNTLFYYNSYNEVLYNFLFDRGIPTSVLLEGSIFDN
jgi:sphingolipid delta-4 desaturase